MVLLSALNVARRVAFGRLHPLRLATLFMYLRPTKSIGHCPTISNFQIYLVSDMCVLSLVRHSRGLLWFLLSSLLILKFIGFVFFV